MFDKKMMIEIIITPELMILFKVKPLEEVFEQKKSYSIVDKWKKNECSNNLVAISIILNFL